MKIRELYFDNVKGVLILLVVFGHLIEPFFYKNIHIKSIYTIIYSFHMPAFIFLSGLFFKPNLKKSFYFLKLFILFQLIRIGFDFFIFQKKIVLISLISPRWSLWYLLSMYFWYTIGFINKKLNIPIWIIFLISIFCGFIPIGSILSFQRTLVYLFIFLLGSSINSKLFKEKIKNMNCNFVMLVGGIFLLSLYIIFINLNLPINVFYNNSSFYKMNLPIKIYSYIFLRVLNFFLAIVLSSMMFYFISDKKSLITKIGQNSLYIYILHTFFIDIIKGFFLL